MPNPIKGPIQQPVIVRFFQPCPIGILAFGEKLLILRIVSKRRTLVFIIQSFRRQWQPSHAANEEK